MSLAYLWTFVERDHACRCHCSKCGLWSISLDSHGGSLGGQNFTPPPDLQTVHFHLIRSQVIHLHLKNLRSTSDCWEKLLQGKRARESEVQVDLFVSFVVWWAWGRSGGWREPIEMTYTHPRLNKINARFETQIRKRTDYSGNSWQCQVNAELPWMRQADARICQQKELSSHQLREMLNTHPFVEAQHEGECSRRVRRRQTALSWQQEIALGGLICA